MNARSTDQKRPAMTAGSDNMIVLTERRVSSERFAVTYKKGMTLVEQTAQYLDGEGRVEAKHLGKPASMLYASESMRLTTRLMQIASWLLLQRAANSGEMTVNQVMQERTKVRLETPSDAANHAAFGELPVAFVELVERSLLMERDIRRMDAELYGDIAAEIGQAQDTNPVNEQIALLRTAFSRG